MDVRHFSLEDDFAAQAACIRPDINQVVGGTHDFLVMLYYNHCVAQCLEFFQYMDEAGCVTAVQSDGGLVEDVERSDE